jgi:ligand-binding sensor domain-containing protein
LGPGVEHINGLTRGKDGTLWLATSAGLLGTKHGHWRRLDERHGLPSPIVYAVAETSDGTVWAGTAAGVARLAPAGARAFSIESGSLPHRWVTALMANGTELLVGTYKGGVTRLDAERALPVAGTEQLWINPHGLMRVGDTFYAATLGDGLARWQSKGDGDASRVVELGPLPSDDVTAVAAYAGALWVGTRGGLARVPNPD